MRTVWSIVDEIACLVWAYDANAVTRCCSMLEWRESRKKEGISAQKEDKKEGTAWD